MSRLEGLREPQRTQRPSPTDDGQQIDPNESFTDDGYVPRSSFDDDISDDNYDDDLDFNDDDEGIDDLEALFDDGEGDIGEDKPRNTDDAFDRFISLLEAREKPDDTSNTDDDTFSSFFDNIYGEGLDFSDMFDGTDTDAETIKNINGRMNEQFKQLTSQMTRQTMTAVMGMVKEHVDTQLNSVREQETKAREKTKLKTVIAKNMPFLKQREHSALFEEVFERAYETSEGDPKKVISRIKKLYRKTNPSLFRNDETSSFTRPTNQRREKRKSTPNASVWANWLNN